MSENDIRQIIIDRAAERGVTKYKLAKETGISEGRLGAYWKGNQMLSEKNLQKIFDYLELKPQ